jgi:thiol-disulfide isomerase/thioredoxin
MEGVMITPSIFLKLIITSLWRKAMKKYSKISILLVMSLLLSLAGMSFAEEAKTKKEGEKKKPVKAKKLKVGDSITEFSLPDGISKGSVSFDKDIKGSGKAIAITFMTTACSACKAELNLLSDLANKYGDDFKIYAISVDLNGEKSIPAYDSAFGFNVRYLLDPDFSIPQRFGFTYTPSLVIAGKDGKITFLKGGYSPSSDPDVIIKAVKEVVK